jgi:hypothetical protein
VVSQNVAERRVSPDPTLLMKNRAEAPRAATLVIA